MGQIGNFGMINHTKLPNVQKIEKSAAFFNQNFTSQENIMFMFEIEKICSEIPGNLTGEKAMLGRSNPPPPPHTHTKQKDAILLSKPHRC
jgi:hypothetical protein